MSFGNFTPVHVQEIPANTLFKVKPEIRFESLPMVSPLYDGFTMRTKFYAVPIRLYIPELRKNRQQEWGSIPNFTFPTIALNNVFDVNSTHTQIGYYSFAGSLLDMLGMAYGFINANQSFNNPTYNDIIGSKTSEMHINAIPLLAYIDCWMRGEYNAQDKLIPVLNENIGVENNSVVRYGYYSYLHYDTLRKFMDYVAGYGEPLNNTSHYQYSRLSDTEGGSAYIDIITSNSVYDSKFNFLTSYPLFSNLGVASDGSSYGLTPVTIDQFNQEYWSTLINTTSNVGLLPTTYKGDYLSSWFNAEGIQRLEQFVVNNGDSYLSMRQKNADFMVELLSTISGDRYTDYLQFIFDTYLELKDHPILVGWDELHFGANEDTTSTAQTGNGNTGVLGAVSSKARDYSNKVKPISFKTQEPLILMVCSTIVPNVVYSQGVDRFMLKSTFADLWHPQYDSRGFQRINVEEYYNPYVSPTTSFANTGYSTFEASLTENYVAPYVPLGWEYMTHKSTLKGGMKTSRYRTWSNLRDFTFVGVNSAEDDVSTMDNIQQINPLSGELVSGSLVVESDPLTNVENWFSSLTSTYVRGIPYNMPFANVDAFDSQNFVVNYGFIVSQYQPITHNLITKTF